MKKDEIKNLIGELKYLQSKHEDKVERIKKYINILDRYTWDIDDGSTIDKFREDTKYIFNEVDEFLLKEN